MCISVYWNFYITSFFNEPSSSIFRGSTIYIFNFPLPSYIYLPQGRFTISFLVILYEVKSVKWHLSAFRLRTLYSGESQRDRIFECERGGGAAEGGLQKRFTKRRNNSFPPFRKRADDEEGWKARNESKSVC